VRGFFVRRRLVVANGYRALGYRLGAAPLCLVVSARRRIRIFVMADTAPPPGGPYCHTRRGSRRTGRKIMVGIEFVGWGVLTVAFTAIQYGCLLMSAGKA
jgi:hypothetical protein